MTNPLPIVPPDLGVAFETLKRDIFVNMNCVQIGIIEDFDAATQTATVQIVIKSVTSVANDGTQTVALKPLVKKAPVMMLYGGSSHITMPIAPGDNCLVLFNDREIDQWLVNGGTPVPETARAHDISDMIVFVGIHSFQNSIANYLTNGVRLAFSTTSKIDLTTNLIESIATLFKHNGNMRITGTLEVDGTSDLKGNTLIEANLHVTGGMEIDGLVTGNGGGEFTMGNGIDLNSHPIHGGIVNSSNGVTGTFTNSVTVLNGIVTAGS